MIVGLLVLAVAAVLLGTGPFLEALLASHLASARVSCASLSVTPSFFPLELVVAPTRCEVDGGPVRTLEFREPATLALRGFAPEAIRLPHLAVSIDPIAPASAADDVDGIPAALRRVVPATQWFMTRAAALSRHDVPSIEILRLEIRHEGQSAAQMEGVRLAGQPGSYRLDVSRATGVSSALRLETVVFSITPSVVDATGVVDASVRVLFVDVGSRVDVRMVGRDLDTRAPKFSITPG